MRIKAIYFILLTGIFSAALLVNLALFQRVFRTDPAEVTIRINKGDNLTEVAEELERNQIILNKSIFILVGKVLGYQYEVFPGSYTFQNGLTNIDVLEKITDINSFRYFLVTIPEGLNIRQIGRLLKKQIGLDSARFVKESQNDSLIAMLEIDAENLEGFLFPDTYRFSVSPSGGYEKEIISSMVSGFRKKITDTLMQSVEDQELDLLKVITLASIIEGETRYEPEKRTISGVYYNRLRKRMKLEADPTVQYVIPDGPKQRLKYSDLKFPSPYNTYLNRGLPPGPINNPGLGSIVAAVYPEDHRYLYFVAKGDGSHRFAETYNEHKQNIQEYRRFLQEQEENSSR